MGAPDRVKELVEKFAEDGDKHSLNETQVRQQYIDPFFEVLEWDVGSRKLRRQSVREVVLEDRVRVSSSLRAPDYGFYLGGSRRFFVEAKKPKEDIERSKGHAFQLRSYGWSANLPLSILTDFEEFAIYDCRVRPNPDDSTGAARERYLTFEQYEDCWDEISDLFSKESVGKGSLDAFMPEKKKATDPVDRAFLRQIEAWRSLLAEDIHLSNPNLDRYDLNFAVQATIDRIVFLRVCEDRGTEEYLRLEGILDGDGVYKRLLGLFMDADNRYNSGLFHFHDERGRSSHDTLTPGLDVSDGVLRDVISGLYPPKSPYQFSVMPVEILGQTYEQFLGSVITIGDGSEGSSGVTVERKPEVRKAGGVYYTPEYIVDYIVEKTVGELVKGKTHRQVANLKIVDPACGSGSFLIGAYDFLLDWHIRRYVEDGPEKHKDKIYEYLYPTDEPMDGEREAGEWRLRIAEKKRILTSNIHGVDIDAQAVEVTKLSLLLKVLEGEDGETMQLSMERILPDLEKNIKCGNSLIGHDFYDNEQMSFLDEDEQRRINTFDWESAFPEVFRGKSPGFDAVVGNPPYLRIQGLQEHYGSQIQYFLDNYQSAIKRFDLYLLFAEKGFDLLSRGGYLGFILPHKFVNSDFGSGLRQFLADNSAIDSFVSFGNNLIFTQATTYTGILTLKKGSREKSLAYYEFKNTPIPDLALRLPALSSKQFAKYNFETLGSKPWTLADKSTKDILTKLNAQPQILGDVTESIMVGVQSGIDDIHVLNSLKPQSEEPSLSLFSERAGEEVLIEADLVKPFLKGEDAHRYEEPGHSHYCIYPYRLVDGKTKIMEEADLKELYPLGYAYLSTYREELRDIRVRQKTNPKYWYSCHRSKSMSVFERERIITPEISLGCNMTIAPAGLYHNTMVYSLVPHAEQSEHLSFWLGLLNARLLWWFLTNTGNVLRGGYFRFKTNYLNPFPIRTIDFSNPDDVEMHDRMVSLVERMLGLHERLREARSPWDQDRIQAGIASTDRKIDGLVYELYGLTDEELELVEGVDRA